MKKTIDLFKSKCLVGSFFLLIFLSCQKVDNVVNKNIIVTSKTKVENVKSILEKQRELSNNFTTNSNDKKSNTFFTVDKSKPVCFLSNKIIWDQARDFVENGNTLTIIPFDDKVKPFQGINCEFFRYLVVDNKGDAPYKINVIEFLGDENFHFINDKESMVIAAFRNICSQKAQSINRINASILYYDDSYKKLSSYKTQNGNWEISRIDFRSDLPIIKK